MDTLILILSTAIVTWGVLHEFVYSKEREVKRLWKIIMKNAIEIGKLKKERVDNSYIFTDHYNLINNKLGERVNKILELYFADNTEQNRLFVEKYKYIFDK